MLLASFCCPHAIVQLVKSCSFCSPCKHLHALSSNFDEMRGPLAGARVLAAEQLPATVLRTPDPDCDLTRRHWSFITARDAVPGSRCCFLPAQAFPRSVMALSRARFFAEIGLHQSTRHPSGERSVKNSVSKHSIQSASDLELAYSSSFLDA